MTNFSGPSRQFFNSVKVSLEDRVSAVLLTGGVINQITEETVEQISGNGQITIRGRDEQLSTTGVSGGQIAVGDIVRVGWKKGTPVVVLSHTAQRAKFVPTFGGGNGIVEELFVAEDENNIVTVWFRNADQFLPLTFNVGDSPFERDWDVVNVVWGHGDADYFIVRVQIPPSADVGLAVYVLNRPQKNEPFPEGFDIVATLVRIYNITTDPATFGDFTLTGTSTGLTQSGSVSTPLKYLVQLNLPSGAGPTDSPFPVNGTVQISTAMVAPNADLLLALHVQAQHSGDSGRTDQVFDMGSLLVNVTRSLLLANRLAGSQSATVYVSPSSAFVCTPVGDISVDCTDGGSVLTAGVITLLSTTGVDPTKPDDPTQAGTFNNFLLLGPATIYASAVTVENPPGTILGEEFCNPTRSTLEFSVQGEFESRNLVFAEFPGSPLGPSQAQIVAYQGSRKTVLYAPYIENGGAVGPFYIRDLESGITQATLNPHPDEVFGGGPTGTPNSQNPLLFATTGRLIYSPFSADAPYDDQFFVSYDAESPAATVDFDQLVAIDELSDQAKLKGADDANATETNLAAAGTTVIQVLNSEENLGSAFDSGPL